MNMLFVGGGPAGVKELVLPKEKPDLFAVGVVEPDAAGVEEEVALDPNKPDVCPVPDELFAAFVPNPNAALPEPPVAAPPNILLEVFWLNPPNGLFVPGVLPKSEGAALLLGCPKRPPELPVFEFV